MGYITFRTSSSMDPSLSPDKGVKVKVYPGVLGRVMGEFKRAILHETSSGEPVWISKGDLYRHVVKTLKKEATSDNPVDESLIKRLFNKHLASKHLKNVPDLIKDIIKEYREN